MTRRTRARFLPNDLPTKTPIKHLVVVFNENRSFDHYFGTYPNALNPEGEPVFEPAKNTSRDINNLLSSPALLTNNPNLNAANGAGATNPFRLDRTQANTSDQNHGYTSEQKAYDGGKNDLFPLHVGKGTSGGAGAFGTTGQVMGYFDGNTVTAFWNYAQNYAMSDNAWGDQFGPSTPGALNMFAGTTNGFTLPVVPPGTPTTEPGLGQALLAAGAGVPNSDGSLTLTGDIDPAGDVCSSPAVQVQMTARNIGDLLNGANIPWGSFVGGFNLETINNNGTTGCKRSSAKQVGGNATDYVPHHIWFQYYASTSNPTHARPTSTKAIGFTTVPGTRKIDPANHAYDLNDFFTAVGSGNYPAVSFIKMASFQDGHPGNSNPLDEQTGLVNLVNFLQEQSDWDSTAVIVAYDDSDGWYDHASAAITQRLVLAGRHVERHGQLRHPRFHSRAEGPLGTARRGPLRSGYAPALRGDLALREEELRQSRADHAGLDPAIHRGQLAEQRASWRRLLRCHDWLDHGHVQFQQEEQHQADPRSDLRHGGYQGQIQELDPRTRSKTRSKN